MRDVMQVRGPDAKGLFVSSNVGLAHRRLSVIDLSPSAAQPMTCSSNRYTIVFNGEIYNYAALRKQLVAHGCRFRSESDTEVLLHGFSIWGIQELLRRVRGMFSFGIWDAKTRKMTLARDHLGKKPLFYRADARGLIFSSDIKSIWIHDDFNIQLNPQALDEYFYYYFISQRQSISKDVSKLNPGCYLEWDATGIALTHYWTPDFSHKIDLSRGEWLEQIDMSIREAVRRRMVGDVPVGAMLSGGVDSSVVCAVMAQESSKRPMTFTAGYSGSKELDERPFAEEVAEHIGSEHVSLDVQPDLASEIANIVWQYGEPFADSSALPSYAIARAAREHVTVVLTGDGGDEAFAGYDRFLAAERATSFRHVPGVLRDNLCGMGLRLMLAMAPNNRSLRRFENLQRYIALRPDAHARFLCVWDGFRESLYGDSLRSQLNGSHPVEAQRLILERLEGLPFVDQSLSYNLTERLPSDYLAKVDVATMAHSLEARSPFLDLDLVEMTCGIPTSRLLERGQSKSLLREYMSNLIPGSLAFRKKAGFEVPVANWFRSSWYKRVEDLLLNGCAVRQGVLRREPIQMLLKWHNDGHDMSSQLWAVLVFEIWLRLFVERSIVPSDDVLAA